MDDELSGGAHEELLRRLVGPGFLDGYARLDSSRRDAAARAASVREAAPPGPRPRRAAPRARAEKRSPAPAPPSPPRLPQRRDRRDEIVAQLREGPASAQDLAERFGISREGVLRWLRMLEADGTICSTAEARTSRNNRWVLSDSGDRGR